MIESLIAIAKEAGSAIMEVYQKESFHEELKADNSPVTEADLKANQIIVHRLKELFPDIHCLSEESDIAAFEERKNWKEYFLVDPLDGTKEFIKRNDEFTVNIAFMRGNSPEIGVVYAPALDVLYYNSDNKSAYKVVGRSMESMPLAASSRKNFVMLASRSHLNEGTRDLAAKFQDKHEGFELVRMGSSLKLCAVAEGSADIYPRMGPTSEWDTAAAHAIVKACGGEVFQYGTMKPLVYNKKNILNPGFEVVRNRDLLIDSK